MRPTTATKAVLCVLAGTVAALALALAFSGQSAESEPAAAMARQSSGPDDPSEPSTDEVLAVLLAEVRAGRATETTVAELEERVNNLHDKVKRQHQMIGRYGDRVRKWRAKARRHWRLYQRQRKVRAGVLYWPIRFMTGRDCGGPGGHVGRPPYNWQSDRAQDICVSPGATVVAVEAGTISNCRRTWRGLSFHLSARSGEEWFYQHTSRLIAGCGARVKAGQTIARIDRAYEGPIHLHIARRYGRLPVFRPSTGI